MLLGRYYDGIEVHREEKIIYVRFLSPHPESTPSSVN